MTGARRTHLIGQCAQRAVAGWLVFAILFATTLGMLHRVVHVPGVLHALPAAAAHAAATRPHRPAQGPEAAVPAAGLFASHGDADCRLYDALAHGAAAVSVPLCLLPMPLPAARFAFLAGEASVRWVALFDARGPPLIR